MVSSYAARRTNKISWRINDQLDVTCYFISLLMFSTCFGHSVELPHWSYCSWFDVCWSFGVVGLEWYPCCRLKSASACNTDTTPTQPHRNSNTHRTKNNTTNVVIQQNSRKLLMMDILMPEICWAYKKWNTYNSKWHQVDLLFFNKNKHI